MHLGIQAATLLGQAPGTGIFSTLCREEDHTAASYALSCLCQNLRKGVGIITFLVGFTNMKSDSA